MTTHPHKTAAEVPKKGDLLGVGLFTAGEIAAKLGRAPRTIYRELSKLPVDGYKSVAGKKTRAWPVESLPEKLRAELWQAAEAAGFRNPETFLRYSPPPWSPSVPLAAIHPEAQAKARKLRSALEWALAHVNDLSISEKAFWQATAEHYRSAFGFPVSDRHLRRLVERTVHRAGPQADFSRLELYLEENPPLAPQDLPAIDAAGQLALALDFLEGKEEPSPQALACFWDAVFRTFETNLTDASSAEEKRLKRQYVAAMHAARADLAKGEKALAQQFGYKLERWREGGRVVAALLDARAGRCGRKAAPQLDDETANRLTAKALHLPGGLSQAWRELWDSRELPAWCFTAFQRGRKSYVPPSVRRQLAPAIEASRAHVIGPKEAKLQGAKIRRDWSNIAAGLQFQSDDKTLDLYFYLEDPTKPGGFKLMRGQFFPWIDTRTRYVATFQLLAKEQYGGLDIVNGILQLHDEYGLPPELYFERGSWMSKIITGRNTGRTEEETLPWEERISGLSELGCTIRHAQGPSAKIVEGVLKQLDAKFARLPGHIGNDERHTRPERITRAMREVETGKAHPGKYFLSYQEAIAELAKQIDAYNDEPQEGRQLEGLSPRQAFHQLHSGDPPLKLSAETRYLLASSRRKAKVRKAAVTVKVGKREYVYGSAALAQREGQECLVWMNIEDPSVCTVTDLRRRQPLSVPHVTVVEAIGATKESIALAQRDIADRMRFGRATYNRLTKKFPEETGRAWQRPVIADEATTELGREMAEQQAAIREQQQTERTATRKAAKLSRETGQQFRADHRDQGAQAAALETRAIIRKHRRGEALTRAEEAHLRAEGFGDVLTTHTP